MLGLFITVAISLMGIMGRILWTQQKRLTQIETTLEAQKEEISFIKALIEKLKASSRSFSRPEAFCKHAHSRLVFGCARRFDCVFIGKSIYVWYPVMLHLFQRCLVSYQYFLTIFSKNIFSKASYSSLYKDLGQSLMPSNF